MIDKLLLNNQILSNKINVQRAKINIINKLVQKIRKIKKLFEKNSENKKLSLKLNKTTDILCSIKKIKSAHLIKKALLNTTNPIVIITNSKSTSDEIAEAMLFSHKIVKEIVEKFKNLFNLDDKTNPLWRDEIQELSKKQQKKNLKFEKIKHIIDEKKQLKELERKRNEWLQQNLPESIKNSIKNDDNSPSTSNENSDKQLKELTATSEIDQSKECIENKPKLPAIKKKIKKEINEENQKKSKRLKEEKFLDPFFITENGENYLCSVSENVDLSSNKNMNNKEAKLYKKSKKKSIGVLNHSKNESSNKYKQNLKQTKQKEYFPQTSIANDRSVNEKKVHDLDKEELHPSWAAKQKLKPTIKEFQGKKIVFDD